MTENQTIAL